MTDHNIGTIEDWLAAREQLLARETEHTRLGDELARQRRELTRGRVEKEYRFDTDDGGKALGRLFDGRSQLLVYHFMFGPSYQAAGTTSTRANDVRGQNAAPTSPPRSSRISLELRIGQGTRSDDTERRRSKAWNKPANRDGSDGTRVAAMPHQVPARALPEPRQLRRGSDAK